MSLVEADAWSPRGPAIWGSHPYRITGMRDLNGELRYNLYCAGLFLGSYGSVEDARKAAAAHSHE